MDQLYHLNDSKSSDKSFQHDKNNDWGHGVSPPQEEVDQTLQFFSKDEEFDVPEDEVDQTLSFFERNQDLDQIVETK